MSATPHATHTATTCTATSPALPAHGQAAHSSDSVNVVLVVVLVAGGFLLGRLWQWIVTAIRIMRGNGGKHT